MKKIYLLLGCSLFLNFSNSVSAQVLVSEDFSSATGTTPPTNWTNNDIQGDGNVWEFDNPGGRNLTLPISDPAAIFDSDNYGDDGFSEDCALESPLFDVSAATNPIFLSFDQYFDADFGGEIHIEVWNGSTWVEVYSSFMTSPDPEHVLLDITSDLNGASDAQVRFRWMGNYSMYWIIDNILVEQVTCTPVTDLVIDNQGTDFLELSWTINGSENAWDIEYGAPGFAPGTGNELGTAAATTNPYTLNGLDGGMMYDVYVRADCGSGDESYWTLVSGATDCSPVSTFPWSDDLESMGMLGYGITPYCWLAENGEWMSDDGYNTGGIANSGSNFLGIFWGSTDYLWGPEFELTAGRTYEFSFMWAGDSYTGWNGSVVVNNSQSSIGDSTLGQFITSSQATDEDYQREFFCFTPSTSGVYSFGINVSASSNPYLLRFDDFSLVERALGAGTDGAANVCQTEGLVDLNDLIVKDDQNGIWQFPGNPSAIVNDSMFNPQFVPAGLVSVNYVTTGCLVDMASAMITIYGPSTAGLDGIITACKHEPIDLLSGLGGTVNFGGDWYDPMNNLLPNSQVITGSFNGQFNYEYITGNGVCPDDTSSIVVNVTNCDWLSVDEIALEEMNLYPNPSTGLVYIESSFSEGSFDLEITDVNGRKVESGNHSISVGTSSVNLSHVEKGTYFFKLSNENAEKVYRVVIQ